MLFLDWHRAPEDGHSSCIHAQLLARWDARRLDERYETADSPAWATLTVITSHLQPQVLPASPADARRATPIASKPQEVEVEALRLIPRPGLSSWHGTSSTSPLQWSESESGSCLRTSSRRLGDSWQLQSRIGQEHSRLRRQRTHPIPRGRELCASQPEDAITTSASAVRPHAVQLWFVRELSSSDIPWCPAVQKRPVLGMTVVLVGKLYAPLPPPFGTRTVNLWPWLDTDV